MFANCEIYLRCRDWAAISVLERAKDWTQLLQIYFAEFGEHHIETGVDWGGSWEK